MVLLLFQSSPGRVNNNVTNTRNKSPGASFTGPVNAEVSLECKNNNYF